METSRSSTQYRENLARYCHTIAKQGVVLGEDDKTVEFELDSHQCKALLAIGSSLKEGATRLSVVHAGGSGKTVLQAAVLKASKEARKCLGKRREGRRDILIAVERSLVTNIRRHLRKVGLPHRLLGMGQKYKQQNRPRLHPGLEVATIQALQSSVAHDVREQYCPSTGVDLIIGDEADKLLTEQRAELVNSFEDSVRIGFTATPRWNDGRDIAHLWGKTVDTLPLKESMQRGICAPIAYGLFEAKISNPIPLRHGDYEPKALAAAMKEIEIEGNVAALYRRAVPKGKEKEFPALVYVPNLDTLRSVTEELKINHLTRGLKISSWSGDELSPTEIESDIQDFDDGKIDILVLCEMGGRGLNLPRARLIIDFFATTSLNKLEQRYSRVTRKVRKGSKLDKEGFKKPFSLVMQVIPESNKFRAVTLLDLLDAWEKYKPGEILVLPKGKKKGEYTKDSGRPNSEEIRQLRARLLAQGDVSPSFRLLQEVDMLKEIRHREAMYKVNKEGFFLIKDEKFAPVSYWAKILDLSGFTIQTKLDARKCKAIQAKDRSNNPRDCYREKDIRRVCADLLVRTETTPEFGVIEIDGEPFASVSTLEAILGLTAMAIRARIREAKDKIRTVKGKNRGMPCNLYSLQDIEFICSDLTRIEYELDPKTNTLTLDNKLYANVPFWAKFLRDHGIKIASGTITSRLRKEGISPIIAKDNRNQKNEVYCEEDVMRVCRDRIK